MHTSHAKHAVLDLFNVLSNHAPLNYNEQESKHNLQFMILTLKEGQGHQAWYKLLGPKQGYNHMQFKRPPLDSVPPEANAYVFVKSVNISTSSLECMQK